jgi:hypothetical protein
VEALLKSLKNSYFIYIYIGIISEAQKNETQEREKDTDKQ